MTALERMVAYLGTDDAILELSGRFGMGEIVQMRTDIEEMIKRMKSDDMEIDICDEHIENPIQSKCIMCDVEMHAGLVEEARKLDASKPKKTIAMQVNRITACLGRIDGLRSQ